MHTGRWLQIYSKKKTWQKFLNLAFISNWIHDLHLFFFLFFLKTIKMSLIILKINLRIRRNNKSIVKNFSKHLSLRIFSRRLFFSTWTEQDLFPFDLLLGLIHVSLPPMKQITTLNVSSFFFFFASKLWSLH